MPVWSDFCEPVRIQTICPKVVWIWSEFGPFSLISKINDCTNGILKFGFQSNANIDQFMIDSNKVSVGLYIHSHATYGFGTESPMTKPLRT